MNLQLETDKIKNDLDELQDENLIATIQSFCCMPEKKRKSRQSNHLPLKLIRSGQKNPKKAFAKAGLLK